MTCDNGHYWQRWNDETAKAQDGRSDQHFDCGRCTAQRVDHWAGDRWETKVTGIVVKLPPQPWGDPVL